MSAMTPREIVHELNKHIVGQDEAKRAVAIALRNRWRRMQLDSSLRDEITPKNIPIKDAITIDAIARIIVLGRVSSIISDTFLPIFT